MPKRRQGVERRDRALDLLVDSHREGPCPFDVLAVHQVLLLMPGREDEAPGEEAKRDRSDEDQKGEDGSEADPTDRLPWTHV